MLQIFQISFQLPKIFSFYALVFLGVPANIFFSGNLEDIYPRKLSEIPGGNSSLFRVEKRMALPKNPCFPFSCFFQNRAAKATLFLTSVESESSEFPFYIKTDGKPPRKDKQYRSPRQNRPQNPRRQYSGKGNLWSQFRHNHKQSSQRSH